MSAPEYRWTLNVNIQVDGTESKKDTVSNALRTTLENALAGGNIDQADCIINGIPIPEGWTVK